MKKPIRLKSANVLTSINLRKVQRYVIVVDNIRHVVPRPVAVAVAARTAAPNHLKATPDDLQLVVDVFMGKDAIDMSRSCWVTDEEEVLIQVDIGPNQDHSSFYEYPQHVWEATMKLVGGLPTDRPDTVYIGIVAAYTQLSWSESIELLELARFAVSNAVTTE